MTGYGGWEIPLGHRTTFMDRGFVGLKDLRRVTDFLYLLRFAAFHFAQRSCWAAAIRFRAGADMILRSCLARSRARLSQLFLARSRFRLMPSEPRPLVRFCVALDCGPALAAGPHEPGSTLILPGQELLAVRLTICSALTDFVSWADTR